MNKAYAEIEPARAQINALTGPVVLEFGAPWCGYCQAAQPLIEAALSQHPQVGHIKVEDARRRPLGRSFAIKLWPTLIFLSDGTEITRLVRPTSMDSIYQALQQIDPLGSANPKI